MSGNQQAMAAAAAAAVAAPAPRPPGDEGQPTPPLLTAPITVGPITVATYGGVPMIAINGPFHHFSGKRLSAMIMKCFEQAGLTIDPDQYQ